MNDDALFDLAEFRAEQEREAAIKRAKAELKRAGGRVCEDCQGEIAETRRRALPSAKRCIQCQVSYEAGLKSR